MRRWMIAALVITIGLVGACGEAGPDPSADVAPAGPILAAGLADLTGPWRASPLRLDPVLRANVEHACRRDIEFPAGSTAAIMDARGAGVVTVRVTGQNPGSCDALEITATGDVVGAGGGWRGGDPEVVARIPPDKLGGIERGTVAGGSLKVEGWSVYGRAGDGIASVVVQPVNHPAVQASLEGGWFSAWWPARPGDPTRDGAQHPPVVVRGYDVFGLLLDEVGP